MAWVKNHGRVDPEQKKKKKKKSSNFGAENLRTRDKDYREKSHLQMPRIFPGLVNTTRARCGFVLLP